MDTELITTIVSLILALLAAFGGTKWQLAKKKGEQLAVLLDRVTTAANKVNDAAKDDAVNEEEFQAINDAMKAVVDAAKELAATT